jgi:hypothetical protein
MENHDVPQTPEVRAAETIGEVIRELVAVAEQLPPRPVYRERTARVLDRLSEEIAEAAALVRNAGKP